MRVLVAVIGALSVAVLVLPTRVSAQWGPSWHLERLGLFDVEHTSADGRQESGPVSYFNVPGILTVNQAGWIGGMSQRFNGSAWAGDSGWVSIPGLGLTRCGLVDALHTRADGFRSTKLMMVGDPGCVIGASEQYSGSVQIGTTAFIWTPSGGYTTVGMTDAAQSPSGIRQWNTPHWVSRRGEVVGSSDRRTAINPRQSVWVWANGSTTRLGFTDAAHTRTNGDQISFVDIFPPTNAGGRIVGYSVMGTQAYGQTAWTWKEGTTTRIGLSGGVYTRPNGWEYGAARAMNDNDQIIGFSNWNNNPDDVGRSAWVWTPERGTVRLGFTGPQFTRGDGVQYSEPYCQNGVGRVAGYSRTYDSLPGSGAQAWTWTESEGTVRIGLTDAEHTSASGRQVSYPTQDSGVGSNGSVTGTSVRYSGETYKGETAWVWTPQRGTVRIGLVGPEYTSPDGSRNSWVQHQNSTGQVVGSSSRYVNGEWSGVATWFYDPAANRTIALDIPIARDGFSNGAPSFLTDSGWVVGNYMLNRQGPWNGSSYVWSIDRGFSSFESLVSTNPASEGWLGFWTPVEVVEEKRILGLGFRGTGPDWSNGFFALAPEGGCGSPQITTQPQSVQTCPGGEARMHVGAAAALPLAYRWQVLIDGDWATLTNEPFALPCGGWAQVKKDLGGVGQIRIQPCGGATEFSVRCIVSTICGSTISETATISLRCSSAADFAGVGGVIGCDGQLTADDIAAYLGAWSSGNPVADLVGLGGTVIPDGSVSVDDLVAFLAAFFAGCP